MRWMSVSFCFFFFQAEDGIRDGHVTGVQTCALPISHLTAGISLLALGLQRRDVIFKSLGAGYHVDVPLLGNLLQFEIDLVLQAWQVFVPAFFVHLSDHVGGEVNDLFEVLGRQIEQVAQTRGNTLEVPNMGNGRGQFNVAHALAAYLGAGYFNAASFTDDAFEAHALVLTAVALPVPGRTEDLFTEKTVLLRLEGAVVDGLRLLNFAIRPFTYIIDRCKADT